MRWLILFLLTLTASAQNIPVDKVWIGKQEWKVTTMFTLQQFDLKCKSTAGCVTLGFTTCTNRSIYLLDYTSIEFGDDDQPTTFIHELQHAVEDCSDAKTTEHNAIYRVSRPLTAVIRDPRNHEVARWLIGETK